MAINAKWIHPSLALRLLKANLGSLEKNCAIIEFALRQPLCEKIEPLLAAKPRILGISVAIWNHTATLELLRELHKIWAPQMPYIILGGPEVSYLPPEKEIFRYADYCIMGEGETAFRELCESILNGEKDCHSPAVFINRKLQAVNVTSVNSAYHLYTDEDLQKKLIYVESSRGCPFSCDFCLSACDREGVREFPLESFLDEMNVLIKRGVKTIKFLDRTFNLNIDRARRIMEFFIEKLNETPVPFVVHFEMIPSRFPPELVATLARFPSGTLRLEIGIQTLNSGVSAHIGRQSDPKKELAALVLLREKTNAVIHADLIAGLPGEDIFSFGKGFDLLCAALSSGGNSPPAEIQLGFLKLLPGTAMERHTGAFGMHYNPLPPYEVTETAAIPASGIKRLKNFARFWELVVNRNLIAINGSPVFDRFMELSDSLAERFGRNWGIDRKDLQEALNSHSLQ